MKKLINGIDNIVDEMLDGLACAYPQHLRRLEGFDVVVRSNGSKGKVALISGGGSGHEPMHGGFVGYGMLDAAAPGEVFTSPTPDQMLEAARAVDGGAGILYIVKNYTGDVMNFEMAAELARSEGMRVQNILIDDDVAVKDSLYTAGRRGVGTTVLAEKICGAAAERGYDLDRLAALCRRVNQAGRSMGMALTSCTVPAKGSPTFELGDDEMELGIGIHGEPGQERMTMKSADEVTEMMALGIIEDAPYTRTVREWDEGSGDWKDHELTDKTFAKGDQLLAFVNSMGGTPISELYIMYRKLAQICEAKGLVIARSLVGPYITSLEMQGASITLLRLDDEMVDLWDAPVLTPALRWGL